MSTIPLNKNSLAQVYIDGLEQKLKAAENRLQEMNAYYQGALSAFSEAKTWEDKIKKYWENIQRTEDLADAVIADLDKLSIQIACVCHNAEQYTKAVQILICCIKDTGIVLEGISTEMRDLMARIDCGKSKEPALDSSKSILKCLEDYRTKLDAALKQTLETLKLALALLKAAQIVLNEKRGLDDFLAYLWTIGIGQKPENEPDPTMVDSDCYSEPGESDPTIDGCPVIQFEACTWTDDCRDITLIINKHTYYLSIQSEEEISRKKRQDIDKQLHIAQQARDGAQSKRDSAFKALADAKKAKECN